VTLPIPRLRAGVQLLREGRRDRFVPGDNARPADLPNRSDRAWVFKLPLALLIPVVAVVVAVVALIGGC